MSKPPALFFPRTKRVLSRKAYEKSLEQRRRDNKDTVEPAHTLSGFWRITQHSWRDKESGKMGKVSLVEQKFSPYLQMPRFPDGIGSFLVGTITKAPILKRKTSQSTGTTYDTYDTEIETLVDWGSDENPKVGKLKFIIQDQAIGQTVLQMFPFKPGSNVSAVGTAIGLAYIKTNEKNAFWKPELYLGKTVKEIIDDLNGDALPLLREAQPGLHSDWEYSHLTWFPGIAEWLKLKEIPFPDQNPFET